MVENKPKYLPIAPSHVEMAIVRAKGSSENLLEYFERAYQNRWNLNEALEKHNFSAEDTQKIIGRPELLAKIDYDDIMKHLDNIGYVRVFGVEKNDKWLMHRTHDENRYNFILIGNDWRPDTKQYVEKAKHQMEKIIGHMGLEIIEDNDLSVV